MSEFKFYLPPINNVRGAQNQYVTGTISDQRKFLKINLEGKRTYIKRAEVVIAKKIMTGTDKSEIAYLPTASNTIGPPGVVSVSEINYAFVDNTVYTIKIKAQLVVDETNEVKTYFAEFGLSPSYEYLHRIDGGDKFILPDLVVVNESLVEGAAGSNISVKCPINFVNPNDTRIPTKVSFLFDEVNRYLNQVSTPNTESLSSYSIDLLSYDPSGNYTLSQTSNNKLINDKAYFVFVTASYSDGFIITGQFSRPLHVIARPVIDSVIAYGLASDQSDADALAISSVMNVNMTLGIVSSNLPSKSGNITFELSQGGVVMYKADLPVSIVTLNGTIPYTVLKENLVKVWTTTAPAQNSNGSYTYDVSAIIDHYTTYENESILKKSAALTKTFTSDIVPLPSVVALNAWIAGANVAGAGDRTVDVANATTASGYALAPELGIVGKFYKNDFYGSGVTAGFFKDLDAVDALTKHKFTVSVNGSAVPVTELHQLQGHDGKTDQEMYIELFESVANVGSPNKYTNANGSFPNLPGPAGILGSAQQPIYFLIPSTGLFVQTNSVKVSVAIEPRAGETTRPAATESDNVIVVSKVNQYVMTVGTASEPRFRQGTLSVPINNPISSEAYFTHAIFTSNLAAPNALKEVSVSTGGVFDIAVVNPNIRGDCNYQVRYKISDPNTSGSITGPISTTYTIQLTDPPGLDNFSVTNFSYKTFHNDSVSSFKFDIAFVTVGTRSLDGVFVYFQSTNDDADDTNDIPLTLLMDVKKSDGTPLPSPNQAVLQLTNVSYTLQSTSATDATLAEGVQIKDKNNAVSANKWLNFRSGKIVFKPYIKVADEKDIQNVQLDITMFNIPVIPMPTNLTLTGGVKESYAATSAAWDDALSTYASIGSSVTASYKLVLNESEVSAANHGYTVDLSGVAASTALTLKLQVKLTASDSLSYLSDTAELSFTAASVDVTGLTSTVKRGSNDTVLRVERGVYALSPASGANVTEVKLIDNGGVASTNPEAATVKVLTMAEVQPVDTTVNAYNLAADGYALGDDLDLQYRLKAGVNYTTKYGAAASSSSSSTPLFLTLASPTLEYIVATKPELQLESTYRVMSSGDYSGRIAINATINAKGLHAEGVLSVVFVLAQEGNFTNPDLSDSGVQYVIAFESVTGLTKSYTVGSNASLVPSSTDNLGATEVHELSVTDVAGFAEGGAGARTLVMGNLLEGDASTLYLDATGFDASRPITAVSVVATRLGNDIVFKELTPSPSAV